MWIPMLAAMAVQVVMDPTPAVTGNCNPTRVHFTGHITADAPGKVTYTFVRVNHPAGRTYTVDFPQPGTLPVTYDLLLRKSEEGWVALRVVFPQQADSAKVKFNLKCK